MSEQMKPSGRGNPCPVCGRVKDGDCRIGDSLVFCHTIREGIIGEAQGDWRFVQTNQGDHGTGMWKHSSVWEDVTKPNETFYANRKEWPYLNADGQHVYSYVRHGEKKYAFTPLAGSPRDYVGDVVLYRNDEAIMAADKQKELGKKPFVFWVEGEKCADVLWDLGLPAVTSQGGCNNLRRERDGGRIPKDVQIILTPDRDRCGIEYINEVAELYPENEKTWVRCYPEKPELWNGKCPEKKGLDVADWLQGVDAEEAKQMLRGAISKEPILLAEKKNPAKGRAPVQAEEEQEPSRLFTDDIDRLLDLELIEDTNAIIPLRAEIKKLHKVNDSKINQELIFAIQRAYSPATKKVLTGRRRSVRRTSVSKTAYLHDGLTPAGAICQTDGPSSAGKSMYEIEKCIAVVEGRGCFDRDHPVKQGSVLFIATDSGANDFYATLDQLGYEDHPAVLQGELEPGEEGYVDGAPSFFIWAESPEDGQKAWTATAAGIAQLIEFCKTNDVRYIVIDSIKTVTGPIGGYTDNNVVAQFLVMLKNTVCLPTGATICLINHDGVIEGEAAGAKAWKENVTMRTRLEPLESPDGKRTGTKATIVKDRIGGGARSFGYRFGSDTAFELMEGFEMVSRCDEQIAWVLWEACLAGKKFLSKASILEATRKAGLADSTVSNTLSQCDMGDLIRKRSHGRYELTANQLEKYKREFDMFK